MALLIHVRSHPDELVGELCDLLATPPDDPFAPGGVAVPTRGIERWLTQRIAAELGRRGAGDGVCANIRFPSPRRLVRQVLVATPELAAAMEAWEGTALTRTVVSVVDEHLDEPWMWLLYRFIDAPDAKAGDALCSPVGLFGPDPVTRRVIVHNQERPRLLWYQM